MDGKLSVLAGVVYLVSIGWEVVASLNLLKTLMYVVLVPAASFVLAQAAAGVIGLYAQRYWVNTFEDREKELLAANQLLRLETAKLIATNVVLASENYRMQRENKRLLKRALKAELTLAHQDLDPQSDAG